MYENNFIVTPIDRNKGNQPESSTCYVGDMNISHSLVSVIEKVLHHFDQDKYSRQNIDRNKHTEKQGQPDDDDDDDNDDDDVVSSSIEYS